MPADFRVTNLMNAGDGSLRQAILDLNTRGDADNNIIRFVDDAILGTIELAVPLEPLAKNVMILGTGRDNLTVQRGAGAGSFGIFAVNPDVTATITDLTIANGRAIVGGGISNAGTLTITNSRIRDNTATRGGGPAFGGGISNSGTLTVSNSIIRDNAVESIFGALLVGGGGIFNSGTLVITNNSVITGNRAEGIAADGGGILNTITGTLTVTSSSILVNMTTGLGGGVRSTSQASFFFSAITGNEAATDGGGLHLSGTGVLFSTEVNGNRAGGKGGGINNSGSLFVLNSPVWDNTAVNGGGGIANDGAGTVLIINSMVNLNNGGTRGGGILNEQLGTVNLISSHVDENMAGSGGGISNAGTVNVIISTINDNRATVAGGAIENNSGMVSLIFSTVTRNRAPVDAFLRSIGGMLINIGTDVFDNPPP